MHQRRTKPRRDRCRAAALVGCTALLCASRAGALSTSTITTAYRYNADGAPTAVTRQVDAGPPATTYLTWDNFIPDAAAPAGGTVSPANGNLLGRGARPGASGEFTYDERDRLVGCTAAGQSVAYAYHPASLMKSSTLSAGDALQFYYDNTGAPRMVNTRQPSTGLTASFLGPVRYLSDGEEQILVAPRKDMAGTYDAAAQSLAPYDYDPYGASTDPVTPARQHVSTSARGPSQYDLSDNPFRYTGEYRDPTCDAYYLRARWYLPAQQAFLSRDRGDALHRYGYTAGNPIGRTDPTGLRATGGFSGRVDHLVQRLTPGIGAYLEPLTPVWGQVLGGMQLAALLPSFWHHPTTQGGVTFGFLAASIAAEGVEAPGLFDRLVANPGRAFGARLGTDVALGGSQTAAQADRHGRVDVPALIQGTDTTLFGIFWARFAGGIGYRPHPLGVGDLDRLLGTLQDDEHGLVFRAREKGFTNPFAEAWLGGATYHEYILGVTRESVMRVELRVGTVDMGGSTYTGPYIVRGVDQLGSDTLPSSVLASRPASYLPVGRFSATDVAAHVLDSEKATVPTLRNVRSQLSRAGATIEVAQGAATNCRLHVAQIVGQLRAVQAAQAAAEAGTGFTPYASNNNSLFQDSP